MPVAARLDRRAAFKKNVEEECQMPVRTHPPEVGDRPSVAHIHRELNEERVLARFIRRSRRVRWGRQDLHTGARSSPGASHAEAAEAHVAPNLTWSASLDLPDHP